MVERAVVLLVDDSGTWWGMGPTLALARDVTAAEVEQSFRSEYGEPPWEHGEAWDTPETLRTWVESLAAVRVVLEGQSEDAIRLALGAMFGPDVAEEVLEELAVWRSSQADSAVEKERRRSL